MTQPYTLHTQAAQAFYEGMAQASHAARADFLPPLMKEFGKRGLALEAEHAFAFSYHVSQTDGTRISPFSVPRFQMEFFACISAINLYRAANVLEQFKTELFTETFLEMVVYREREWLGLEENTQLPHSLKETGYPQWQWRINLVQTYMKALYGKSSRDKDCYIASRRFLNRHGLAKEVEVPISPALLEGCATLLEPYAGWMQHYLCFHPL